MLDANGHPLTWGRVLDAHSFLVDHALCDRDGRPAPYDSDDEGDDADRPCPCQWHAVMMERRSDELTVCHTWPGPWCGACWRASCRCGYVFESVHDAARQGPLGRLQCHACAEEGD